MTDEVTAHDFEHLATLESAQPVALFFDGASPGDGIDCFRHELVSVERGGQQRVVPEGAHHLWVAPQRLAGETGRPEHHAGAFRDQGGIAERSDHGRTPGGAVEQSPEADQAEVWVGRFGKPFKEQRQILLHDRRCS
jgi:hypothetical protein